MRFSLNSELLSSPHASEYFRESIRQEIRMARERFSGRDLSQELRRIQKRLDSVELLTADIVINLLLSYRDIQVRLGADARTAMEGLGSGSSLIKPFVSPLF